MLCSRSYEVLFYVEIVQDWPAFVLLYCLFALFDEHSVRPAVLVFDPLRYSRLHSTLC